ncbi:hypothetical protein [Rubinisphaera brasiliensis]|uniref:Uncharacterized protein n=1 Tax=Rubinisphaera brasiliensis (strain ATCC 49424 / DSM 5305 / JCM 21570 / IAM 15109 / NBRC 103401 / IFAM 1448) TaxID=756272 RepID=F0SJ59_RUBBR|nr:hypothetical protein [Rubinisphaera brasiliensis]ADY58601.1 hypothetical protein Plabr_0980 [Rubinisphaera brasiliensis DSM 5305]
MPVRIVNGANDGHRPFAGLTIGEIRRRMKDVYNLFPTLIAWVNGNTCDDATILRDGDHLEFGQAVGRKVGIPDFVSENEVRQLYGDDGFRRMTEVGLTPTMQLVFTGHEVAAFGRSLGSGEPTLNAIPVSVDVESESVTFNGTTYECDRSIALGSMDIQIMSVTRAASQMKPAKFLAFFS